MTASVTRRALLQLAGTSSLLTATAGAARAEGGSIAGEIQAKEMLANTTPIRIGSVALRVRDLDRMSAFYRDVIGLSVIERTADEARLGAGGVPLLTLLRRPDAQAEPKGAAGLYHTAFLMPSRKALGRWLVHVAVNRVQLTGFADHAVSEAVYLDDPEGNGIEVYSDRDPILWQWRDGVVTMGTNPLDIDGLLALANTRLSDYAAAPEGLRIGHMHLRVGDLVRAGRFYREAVGLAATTRPRQDAAFLSSGGYHHHLGMNTWESAGAGPRDDSATGLAWFTLQVSSGEILEQQERRLRQSGATMSGMEGGIEAADPWGTRVRIVRA